MKSSAVEFNQAFDEHRIRTDAVPSPSRRRIGRVLVLAGAALLAVQLVNFSPNSLIPGMGLAEKNDFVPKPTGVKIPALNTDASVVELGLNRDGTLEVPKDERDVGWFRHSPAPGGEGPAVMVGHLDSVSGPAVFYDLEKLKPGDEVEIYREDGSVAVYKVDSSEKYSQDNFPTEKVYGAIDHAGIRLITCSGTYSLLKGRYSENLVVYGTLVRISKS